jgi:chitodextrinase
MSFFRTHRSQLLRGALCDEDNFHCDYRSFVRLGFNRGIVTTKLIETVPDPPIISRTTRGNGSVTIYFSPPVKNGNAIITSYIVTSTPGNFTTTVSASPATVNGLTNGTAYTFTVVAVNKIGNSSPSAASASTTPATVPDAPTSVAATPYDHRAVVTWTAPSNNGGSAITRYVIAANPDDVDDVTVAADQSTALVTGLRNGTTYTFTVSAVNAVGNSNYSSPSSGVIPRSGLAGSLRFNSTDNTYLSLVPGFIFGNYAFSIEFWFYSIYDVTNCGIIGQRYGLSLFFADDTHIAVAANSNSADRAYTVARIMPYTWNHLALCRNATTSGSIETVFLNGEKASDCQLSGVSQNAQQQQDLTVYAGTETLIGKAFSGGFDGYITNMRVVVDATAYDPTATDIPLPSAPLSGVQKTKYLMLGNSVTTDTVVIQNVTNHFVTQTGAYVPF